MIMTKETVGKMLSLNEVYMTFMRNEEISWDMVADLEDQQSECVDADFSEVARSEELSLEIKDWKQSAEYCAKQMSEMEGCMHLRLPNQLKFPPLYSARYDALYDKLRDQWLESKCSDECRCEYCYGRPDKPSQAKDL